MSRKGNPYDNAAGESFMKTLKHEEVYRNDYRDFQDARTSIGEFLECVYNQKRLHSALGYVPPADFENGATPKPPQPFRPLSRRSGSHPCVAYPPLRNIRVDQPSLAVNASPPNGD